MPVKVLTVYRDETEVNAARPGENLRLRLQGIEEEDISAGGWQVSGRRQRWCWRPAAFCIAPPYMYAALHTRSCHGHPVQTHLRSTMGRVLQWHMRVGCGHKILEWEKTAHCATAAATHTQSQCPLLQRLDSTRSR